MFLIAFTGEKRHGKDTAAKAFPEATRVAFADPVKDATIATFRLDPSQLYDGEKKEIVDPRYNKTPRQLAQMLGTDWCRNQFDSDHWMKIAEMDIKKLVDADKPVVVTDARFDNEVMLIRQLGGYVVKIYRPGMVSGDCHESEKGVSPHLIDHTIVNDGSVEDLMTRLQEWKQSWCTN